MRNKKGKIPKSHKVALPKEPCRCLVCRKRSKSWGSIRPGPTVSIPSRETPIPKFHSFRKYWDPFKAFFSKVVDQILLKMRFQWVARVRILIDKEASTVRDGMKSRTIRGKGFISVIKIFPKFGALTISNLSLFTLKCNLLTISNYNSNSQRSFQMSPSMALWKFLFYPSVDEPPCYGYLNWQQ